MPVINDSPRGLDSRVKSQVGKGQKPAILSQKSNLHQRSTEIGQHDQLSMNPTDQSQRPSKRIQTRTVLKAFILSLFSLFLSLICKILFSCFSASTSPPPPFHSSTPESKTIRSALFLNDFTYYTLLNSRMPNLIRSTHSLKELHVKKLTNQSNMLSIETPSS